MLKAVKQPLGSWKSMLAIVSDPAVMKMIVYKAHTDPSYFKLLSAENEQS